MLKTKTARPAKAGTPNLVKAETANEARGGDQYFSRAVGKALEVLEFLQAELKPLSMNEIRQRIQLSKTSAFRILRTLETLGCVTVDGRGQYLLAPGIHAVRLRSGWASCTVSACLTWRRSAVSSPKPQPWRLVLKSCRSDRRGRESPRDPDEQRCRAYPPPERQFSGQGDHRLSPQEQRERLLRSFGTYRFTKHTITDRKELSHEYEGIRVADMRSTVRNAPTTASASARQWTERPGFRSHQLVDAQDQAPRHGA